MKRRELVTILGGIAASSSITMRAQQAVIGFLYLRPGRFLCVPREDCCRTYGEDLVKGAAHETGHIRGDAVPKR
jgi:hypothetical protein